MGTHWVRDASTHATDRNGLEGRRQDDFKPGSQLKQDLWMMQTRWPIVVSDKMR